MRISDAAAALKCDRIEGDRISLYQQKTGTPVYVPVPDFVIKALRSVSGEEYVFWSGRGELSSALGDWARAFKSISKRAGVEGFHSPARWLLKPPSGGRGKRRERRRIVSRG